MRMWMGEFRQAFLAIFKDPAAFSVMVLAILIYGLLYPQPYLGEVVREAPIVVVDQDHSATSRELVRRVDAQDSVAVAHVAADIQAARRILMERQAHVILVIPPMFERDLLAGRAAPVAAYGDASYLLIYNTTMTAMTTATREMGAQIAIKRMVQQGKGAKAAAAVQPLTISAVPLFNPQGGYASYVVPASVVLILQQTLLMGTALLNSGAANVRLRDRPMLVLSARVLAYSLLYGVWLMAYLVLLPMLLGLPRIGGLVDMFIIGLPFLLSTIFMGLALSTILPVREWVVLGAMVTGMPLFFLSGIAWPMEMLPGWLQQAALLFGSSSAIPAMVRVNQMGSTWQEVAPQVGVLWMLTTVYGGITLAALGWSRSRRVRPA